MIRTVQVLFLLVVGAPVLATVDFPNELVATRRAPSTAPGIVDAGLGIRGSRVAARRCRTTARGTNRRASVGLTARLPCLMPSGVQPAGPSILSAVPGFSSFPSSTLPSSVGQYLDIFF